MGEMRINCSEWYQFPLLSLGKVTISTIFPVSRAGSQQLHLCWRYGDGGAGKKEEEEEKKKRLTIIHPPIQFSLQQLQHSGASVRPQAESLINL